MRRTSHSPLLISMMVLCASGFFQAESDGLKMNFYETSCPRAEDIVKEITAKNVKEDPGVPADLLRLHYHDCFVRGCDGSVLLDSTPNNVAEKDASPNLTLDGFDVIQEIKEELENVCPRVVSCADILALAARDAVSNQFKKDMWQVLTGRRDSTVSKSSEADAELPLPTFNFQALEQTFARKGLTMHDLVVLSGAHTIGQAHCDSFSNRLFNFSKEENMDPSLLSDYASDLKKQCRSLSDHTTTVFMDPDNSGLNFDSHYYLAVNQHKGLFQSDAALLTNEVSSQLVNQLMKRNTFFENFAISMKKMGAIGVLTGESGEIRKKCNVVNN
ncbi:peroxidase 3-like [Macadamia integrifolia]|uniref:peroxidase 3-like n=1 Tax=Macadamia integrifolia TaxID=60698 RepID=UPI001C4F58AE|nr:peroxidase 3-like [Macadamia integrifolia]